MRTRNGTRTIPFVASIAITALCLAPLACGRGGTDPLDHDVEENAGDDATLPDAGGVEQEDASTSPDASADTCGDGTCDTGGDGAATGPLCEDDDECASGSVCLDGICYAVHCSITGCPAELPCDPMSGLCEGGLCDMGDPPPSECESSQQCRGGLICLEGDCVSMRCTEGSCPQGSSCVEATGLCRPPPMECTCGMCGTPMQ
jgi:hypothetical protein